VDSGVASVIAAVVAAIASVAVALITTRVRTDRPSVPVEPSQVQTREASIARVFRGLGWSLVGFLYFAGVVLTAIAITVVFNPYAFFTYRFEEFQAGLESRLSYESPVVLFTILVFAILALLCFLVALIGTTRLLRSPP
jgi:hypothetical protein